MDQFMSNYPVKDLYQLEEQIRAADDNLPALVKNGNDLEFRFTYLSTTTLTGFLQCSADLMNWVNATPGVDYEVISETVNVVETTVRYRVLSASAPVGSSPSKFFKIAVSAAP